MRKMLDDLLRFSAAWPAPAAQTPLAASREELQSQRIDAAGIDSASRPHAFVAIPFSETFEDVFYFGIQPSVQNQFWRQNLVLIIAAAWWPRY